MRTKIVGMSSKTEDWLGLQAYLEHTAEDNSRQKKALSRVLRVAMKEELTQRQQDMLRQYYFEEKTITQIAEEYGLNKSTVSRHITRSKERLERVLKYVLMQRNFFFEE